MVTSETYAKSRYGSPFSWVCPGPDPDHQRNQTLERTILATLKIGIFCRRRFGLVVWTKRLPSGPEAWL